MKQLRTQVIVIATKIKLGRNFKMKNNQLYIAIVGQIWIKVGFV
jgi:hypothetical protein